MAGARGRYPTRFPVPGALLCLPGRAEDLRWHPLSEIEKPGSGAEPIHQEHRMCSRFRGSCPSDVKSAGHPEPGFPISLSGRSAAQCAPQETQKNPAVGSVPGYRPLSPALRGGLTHDKPLHRSKLNDSVSYKQQNSHEITQASLNTNRFF